VGINEVLAKPVIPEKLARAIDVHCAGIVPVAPEPQPLLNQQALLGLGGNPDRVRQFRVILSQDIDAELKSLQCALEQEDREWLRRAAHTLKGLCGQLTNQAPCELAAWLQANASSAPADQMSQVAGQLRTVCHSLLRQEERL
jgi:HPt (histidine-containing phosphotransfer) domain-containing protein